MRNQRVLFLTLLASLVYAFRARAEVVDISANEILSCIAQSITTTFDPNASIFWEAPPAFRESSESFLASWHTEALSDFGMVELSASRKGSIVCSEDCTNCSMSVKHDEVQGTYTYYRRDDRITRKVTLFKLRGGKLVCEPSIAHPRN